jgi:predicted MFS family arabinose efflux permease
MVLPPGLAGSRQRRIAGLTSSNMFSRKQKQIYFTIEGLNSFATVYYFYYFYFFMQKEYGFGNKANLLLAALNGLTYAIGAWWSGRLAHKYGYLNALRFGFLLMIGGLLIGGQLSSAAAQIVVMVVVVLGMCFTWPVLEALASENESRQGLQRMVGIYNVVWAATGAVSYFVGGAMLDHLGMRSLFYVPAIVLAAEFLLATWAQKRAGRDAALSPSLAVNTEPEPPHPHPQEHTQAFLRMAWLTNPFAYIAINTVIAVVPGVAHRLGLSTMLAGFCCSVWCFARFGAFTVLWLWDGWHYRFRWLLLAYIALVASFATILIVPHLATLVIAQIFFGGAVGLLYYSSLFYSMDLSEVKSEHGGIHEAAIGLGNMAGPTVGALALQFLPRYADSGSVAVSGLLLLGMAGLLGIWTRRARPVPVPSRS